MDSRPPGSSVHGIFQARILEWAAISFSRRSSQPKDRTCVSWIGRRILYHWATREAPIYRVYMSIPISQFISPSPPTPFSHEKVNLVPWWSKEPVEAQKPTVLWYSLHLHLLWGVMCLSLGRADGSVETEKRADCRQDMTASAGALSLIQVDGSARNVIHMSASPSLNIGQL